MSDVYSKQIHSKITFGGIRAVCRKSWNLWKLRYWECAVRAYRVAHDHRRRSRQTAGRITRRLDSEEEFFAESVTAGTCGGECI